MRGMLSEPSMVISTHALTWSATVAMCVQGDWFLFQLTHSRGVRQLQFGIFAMRMGISTHALTWSATINHLPPRPKKKPFQLTHSRGVRLLAVPLLPEANISTHALTWSATMRGMLSEPSMVISTHALTWSATVAMCVQGDWFLFQLTHSRGVRRPLLASGASAHIISTHALTWSATGTVRNSCSKMHISTHALTWSATYPSHPSPRST